MVEGTAGRADLRRRSFLGEFYPHYCAVPRPAGSGGGFRYADPHSLHRKIDGMCTAHFGKAGPCGPGHYGLAADYHHYRRTVDLGLFQLCAVVPARPVGINRYNKAATAVPEDGSGGFLFVFIANIFFFDVAKWGCYSL